MDYALGVLVSLIVQGAKKWGKVDGFGTYIILAALSLAVGYVYVLYANTALWQTLVQVVLTAAGFHNLILRKFEE